MGVDFFSLLVLTLAFCYFSLRQILQIKHFKTEQIMILISIVAMGVIIVSEYLVFYDQMSLLLFEKVLRPVLGLIYAIFLTLISLLSLIDGASQKKIKTLWRIPIIGFLAGLYFELQYILYICLGNIILSIIISKKNMKYVSFLRVKIIPLFLPVLIIMFAKIEDLEILNLGLIVCVLFGAPVYNIANIRAMMSKTDEIKR